MVLCHAPCHKVLFIVERFYEKVRSSVIFFLHFLLLCYIIENIKLIIIIKLVTYLGKGMKTLYGYIEFSS